MTDLVRDVYSDSDEEQTQVLTALFDIIPRERQTFQILAARQLAEWMDKNTFKQHMADKMFKPIRAMMNSRDQDVFYAWADLLLVGLRWMSQDILLSEIMPEAILNGGISQPAPVRLWSCRVLGALSKRLDGPTIESTFFRKAMSLCQDIDDEVRTCMCLQLNSIARAVG